MQLRNDKIYMFYPHISEKQIAAVVETLHSRFVGQGPKVDAWEKAFKEKFGTNNPVALNSGTAALETAYELAGIKPGDKVITTPFTCTATNLPLLRMGAILLFADIRLDTFNIDPASIKDLLIKHGGDVKAIVNVHLGGIESRAGLWMNAAGDTIPMIDDCAQALGIYRSGAEYSCYSFQAIKHVTTGDGGMLVVNTNEDEFKKAKRLRWFGIDREKKQENDWQAYRGREMTFDIEELGFKRQPTDIDASLGIAGLEDFDEILEHRRKIFEIYKSIKVDSGFKLIDALHGEKNVYWTAGALVSNRDAFAKHLKDWNIETNVVQVRNDLYTVFGGKRLDLPNLNYIEDKYIYIPLHNKMTLEDAHYVKEVIEKGW